jgi:primosomal protein N' (replication factor Y) (superfamily II helicase)
VKGWILGESKEVPEGRLLPVRKVRSRVRFFDDRMLELLRWVSERYIVPLSTAIDRSHPPRVAGEETDEDVPASRRLPGLAAREPATAAWVRPLPGREAAACVEAAEACLLEGRRALVLVPEADPLPETARAVLHAFGKRAVLFAGGVARERYRAWLDIRSGAFEVVVGSRPAVFAPLDGLGLIWVSREVHPGHREERSPYYHVREVALARGGLEDADCLFASLSPSVETVAAVEHGTMRVRRPAREAERAVAPLVETVGPHAEDRSPRLASLLKRASSAAIIVSRPGYGIARVCKACHEPAACAACRGPIVVESGVPTCRVCSARGICANCGGREFGVERGGTERIAEWARGASMLPVSLETKGAPLPVPGVGRVVVGTAASVKELGPTRLDLVAILDPDRALTRAGLHSGEQALATWMEAASWAGPRKDGGRVLMQTRHPGHPAIQALVRWDPVAFLMREALRRREAGFAAGHPVFRVDGPDGLENALASGPARPETLLATAGVGGTVCLVAVSPGDLSAFRELILRLAGDGRVTRVQAEPQL